MAGRVVAAATVRAVKNRKLLPTRAALVLTPKAVEKIKTILEGKDEYIGLKVGVRQRGCNGLSYTLDYAKEKNKLDEEVVQDGVRIFIDKKAQLTLLGTEMDYVESKLSSEFVFNNPNIKDPPSPLKRIFFAADFISFTSAYSGLDAKCLYKEYNT